MTEISFSITAVFGIYNAKDIQTKDGKVIVKADTLLQKMTSDEKGQAVCTLDLPLGSYYVKELKAPDGFVLSEEVLRFDASYQGQDVQTVTESRNSPFLLIISSPTGTSSFISTFWTSPISLTVNVTSLATRWRQ